jgi:hypothetical protein
VILQHVEGLLHTGVVQAHDRGCTAIASRHGRAGHQPTRQTTTKDTVSCRGLMIIGPGQDTTVHAPAEPKASCLTMSSLQSRLLATVGTGGAHRSALLLIVPACCLECLHPGHQA